MLLVRCAQPGGEVGFLEISAAFHFACSSLFQSNPVMADVAAFLSLHGADALPPNHVAHLAFDGKHVLNPAYLHI
jgi:hypothetical protein